MKKADKEEIIAAMTEIITNAPKETQRMQIILLGQGGWISTDTWDVVEKDAE